ncbi:class I adenylate cyclase [Shigella flexneri]
MIEARNYSRQMHQDAAPPDSVEVFCYSQHLRGLIRTRVQQLVSECIELRLPAPARKPGVSRRCAFLVKPGLVLRTPNVSVQKLENAIEFMALFRITNCTACQCRLKPITSNYRRWWTALLVKGLSSSSSKKTQDENGFNTTVSTKATGLRRITTAKAAKRNWCATSVALLVIARPLHLRLKLHHFNLPQFYQIVKVDGREQVIPFRTKSIGNMPPANQDYDTPLLQHIFRDERAGKRGLSGMQS